jgi:hypothetical protein
MFDSPDDAIAEQLNPISFTVVKVWFCGDSCVTNISAIVNVLFEAIAKLL